jgi:hypothetical protein
MSDDINPESSQLVPADLERGYQLLRSWYLARLRRGALDDEARMHCTPATLIEGDQELVARLVAMHKSTSQIAPMVQPNYLPGLDMVLVGAFVSIGWLFIADGGDLGLLFMDLKSFTLDLLVGQTPAALSRPGFPQFLVFMPAAWALLAVVILCHARRSNKAPCR